MREAAAGFDIAVDLRGGTAPYMVVYVGTNPI